MMMDAGTSLLLEEGLGVGASALTFKRVFERIEATQGVRLTNASVIRRVWENQAEFQDDVLVDLALGGDSSGDSDEVGLALLPVLAGADRSTPDGRTRGLQQVCRVGGDASLRAMVGSRAWSVWVGIWVLAVTTPPTERGRRVHRALLDGYEATTGLWEAMHGGVLAHLGFRVRAPYTVRQLTVSVGALVEGCALRAGAESGTEVVLRPTGPEGADEEWTLFGIGLEALLAQYTELDPDWVPDPGPD